MNTESTTRTSDELHKFLADLSETGFYGTVEIKFEAGRVVLVRKTESIKLADHYRDNRGKNNALQ